MLLTDHHTQYVCSDRQHWTPDYLPQLYLFERIDGPVKVPLKAPENNLLRGLSPTLSTAPVDKPGENMCTIKKSPGERSVTLNRRLNVNGGSGVSIRKYSIYAGQYIFALNLYECDPLLPL